MKRRSFLGYSVLFLAGCKATINNPNGRFNLSAKNRPATLRFTVTDRKGLERLKRDYEPFRKAIEEVLQKKIEFFPTENYLTAVSALQLDQVDLVLAGPSEYVLITSRTNAVPLITIVRPKVHSVIAVRGNSGIKSLADLKNKTIGLGEIGGTTSHIGPTKMLIDAGLNVNSDLKIIMLGTEGDKGLHELQKGEVDAWGGSVHRYEKFLKVQGVSESSFPPIKKGPSLPGDVLVANSKLEPAFVKEIRELMLKNQKRLMAGLLATESNQKYKDSKLAPANDADYNIIREVYKVIGQGDFIE